MKPGHYIGGGQRLTDDDMDAINADIQIPRSRWVGWYQLAAALASCAFWYGAYQFLCWLKLRT